MLAEGYPFIVTLIKGGTFMERIYFDLMVDNSACGV